MPRDRLPDGFDLRLLPPRATAGLPDDAYDAELARVQRFRGGVYLRDGAIPPAAVEPDGRFVGRGDDHHWQVYMEAGGAVTAAYRLIRHGPGAGPADLYVRGCVERMPADRRPEYEAAFADWVAAARAAGVAVGEVGGWAVGEAMRGTRTALLLPLSAWAVFGLLGPSWAVCSATHRHRSADILNGLGGFPLACRGIDLPRFFDEFHACDLEFVAFASDRPADGHLPTIHAVRDWLRGRYACGSSDCEAEPVGGRRRVCFSAT